MARVTSALVLVAITRMQNDPVPAETTQVQDLGLYLMPVFQAERENLIGGVFREGHGNGFGFACLSSPDLHCQCVARLFILQ